MRWVRGAVRFRAGVGGRPPPSFAPSRGQNEGSRAGVGISRFGARAPNRRTKTARGGERRRQVRARGERFGGTRPHAPLPGARGECNSQAARCVYIPGFRIRAVKHEPGRVPTPCVLRAKSENLHWQHRAGCEAWVTQTFRRHEAGVLTRVGCEPMRAVGGSGSNSSHGR